MRHRVAALLLAALATTPAAAAELIRADGARIELTAKALDALPARDVDATAHDQRSRFRGHALIDVLHALGGVSSEPLRGKRLDDLVIVTARDGYRVVFSLAELDAGFGATDVLLADRENGAALPNDDGPLRLVIPKDTRPARWIRQIDRIEIRDAP